MSWAEPTHATPPYCRQFKGWLCAEPNPEEEPPEVPDEVPEEEEPVVQEESPEEEEAPEENSEVRHLALKPIQARSKF